MCVNLPVQIYYLTTTKYGIMNSLLSFFRFSFFFVIVELLHLDSREAFLLPLSSRSVHPILNSINSVTKTSENIPSTTLLTHQHATSDKASTASNLQFLKSLTLSNWGVFAQADVCFSSSPTFITITGETGAGKSVFLSALQYITGRTTARSMFVKRKEFKPDCSISITICKMGMDQLHSNNEDSTISMKRIYNTETKKSVAEINGSKVPIKTITSKSAKVVRFWSSDSISKLDSKEFISYVDANLHPSEVKQLEELSISHDEWLHAYNKLSELRQLKNRMDNNDEEFRLISHFISEVDNFSQTLGNVFYDTAAMLEDHFVPPDNVGDDKSAQPIKNSLLSPSLDSNDRSVTAKSVLTKIRDVMKREQKATTVHVSQSKETDLSVSSDGNSAWNALVSAEDFYKDLISSITTAFSSSTQSSKAALPRSSNSISEGDSSGFNSLQSARTCIDDYAERLLTLQEDLKDLGCVRATADGKVDLAYASLQDAAAALTKAVKAIKDFTKTLPNLKSHLIALSGIKAEWEKLARKHGY